MKTLRLLLLLLAQSAFALPQADRAADEPLEELAAALERLDAELDAEEERIAALRRGQAEEREALIEKRRGLASAAVALELERERQTAHSASLRRELEGEEGAARVLEGLADSLVEEGARVAERLALHLDETPGGEAAAERLRDALRRLREDSGSSALEALADVLAIAGDFHADGTALAVRRRPLRTAAGRLEEVKLLAAGHVAFAYVTLDGERAGVALASPADARGYRWTESLRKAAREQVLEAVRRVEAGGASMVDLPLDVSRRLRAEALSEGEGLLATLRSGGPVMAPLGVVALLALLLVAERSWLLWRQGARGDPLLAAVRRALKAGEPEAAERLCAAAKGVVARVLAAALRRRAAGQSAMEDGIQEQLLHELPRLQRNLRGIAILAAVAPLLGLLGTVTGIINTFTVIRASGNTQPALMAGGISEALVTTAAGLVIAIPLLLFHSLLGGKADRILADAEKSAASLLATVEEA
jgi:biopolymer transport protein ExbB